MKVLEVCKVFPANSPSQFSLPLTFLDMFWLQFNPTSRLFFFEVSQTNTETTKGILLKLKISLSYALQHYLPLAGNLIWPQNSNSPVIEYNIGDGISLTVAETLSDFDSLSQNDFRESVELHSLLPDFPCTENLIHAMTLKFTFFPNKGFSIGYVAHHGVLDGKSISMFIHSWAYICKNEENSVLPQELTPFYDRSFVKYQGDLQKVYPKVDAKVDFKGKTLNQYDTSPLADTLLATVKLTREDIETLKKSVLVYDTAASCVSTFAVTSAYIIVCLIKARNVSSPKTYIAINVDGRAKLTPPLPSTYFGNCVLGCGGGCNTKDFLVEDGFFVVAKLITEALAFTCEGAVKLAEHAGSVFPYIPEGSAVFSIAGSPQFELYKADFGWGKPRKVEMISIDKSKAFYLSDDRDENGGIEIGIGLERHETEAFVDIFTSGLRSLVL